MIQMVPFRVRKYLFSSTLPVTHFSFLPFLRCLDTTENKGRQHFPTNLHFSTRESNNCKRLLQTSKEFEKQQAQTLRAIEHQQISKLHGT